MKIRVFSAIFLVCLFFQKGFAAEIDFFPSENWNAGAFPALLRSPAIEILYAHEFVEKNDFMLYHFGASIPLLRVSHTDVGWEIGGLAGVFSRFQLNSDSFNFIHADFMGGAYLNLKITKILFENSFYHVSSHLGDDEIRVNESEVKNTGYEAWRTSFRYESGKIISWLLGFEYKIFRRPKDLIFSPFLIFAGTRLDFLSMHLPFFLEWQGEWLYSEPVPNLGLRMGIYLEALAQSLFRSSRFNPPENHEFSMSYYSGYSKMGSFFKKKEQLLLFGITYRL